MENLLLLLNKISEVSPLGVFNQEVIVVQNAGMQHWLNLAIAKERGISMNMCYALPAQYLWKLIRTIASDDNVPEQSPYSREVLTWRIYALLATEQVIEDTDFSPATQYWQQTRTDKIFSSHENLKRYQLAQQMADLYEQYLIFRPQWLDSWQKDDRLTVLSSDNKWQAKLWRLLIKQLPYNPVELLNDAISNIESKLLVDPLILPKRLSFFGINSMAPLWLTFINALSDYIEVNFFHLNPCFSYWGDIISEKQAFDKLSHWSHGVDDTHIFIGNPLLANLGQQGREFLALLQDYSTVDVELFVEASVETSSQNDDSEQKPIQHILHHLQNDILTLNDATQTPIKQIDDSVTIVSCHSALREVQALHDYLLHQFNNSASNDKSKKDRLTPKDVLVMCPQIEQYAPYVNAVFTRGWQELNDEVPPLPCSIADRSAKDSDPLIAAFSELLTLPDSRFQVSQLLSFLRLPAVANKFSINDEDCEKITLWLEQATVHWGLDLSHKAQLLGKQANNSFTWQQGLSRLLRGFAFSDHESVYQDQLLLPTVEGDDAVLLGQLMLFVEQLQHFAQQLITPRTAGAWQQFLLKQLDLLFATSRVFSTDVNHLQINSQIENSLAIIEQAISSLVEYCTHAHFDEKIDLAIVVDFLNNHFSQGDASRQFMIGQVTFCSMLPMRSIPFKIIAVLGLNDGEFPRQRQPLGFDLMAQNTAVLGDRSRRGDDRYLFLEAIISARKALYLSYQGRNIKNNSEKQPSLVLKELMDYLTQGYGWAFNHHSLPENSKIQLQQIPMQPFSEENYLADNALSTVKASFDANWFKLSQNTPDTVFKDNDIATLIIHAEAPSLTLLEANEIIRFFQHPSKVFAQQTLNLFLDSSKIELDDVEPFSTDYLESYLLKQQLLSASLQRHHNVDESIERANVEQVIQMAKLSGKFPDLPTTQDHFDTWLDDTELFSQAIIQHDCDNPQLIDCKITLDLSGDNVNKIAKRSITIMAKMPAKITKEGGLLVFYRSSSPKPKDLFTLYLHQLILQIWQQQYRESSDNTHLENVPDEVNTENVLLNQIQSTCGFYFNAKSQKVEQFTLANIDNAQAELIHLIKVFEQGQKQALLLNGDLAALAFKQSRGKHIDMTQERFEEFWFGSDNIRAFGDDPYIHYFWPQCPDIFQYLPDIYAIYQNVYQYIVKVSSRSKGER